MHRTVAPRSLIDVIGMQALDRKPTTLVRPNLDCPHITEPSGDDEMVTDSPSGTTVVPAQLFFLAIYNPLLGEHDDTLHDQVVFYSSLRDRTKRSKRRKAGKEADGNAEEHEENNEKLRQIGLAQGMIEFAKYDHGSIIERSWPGHVC